MTLFKESKRRLFLKRLDKSILKNSTGIKYLEEVYDLMDLVYIVLGVNEQQIPFFVSAHPGNTPDVAMFGDFLKTMRSKYQILNDSARHKIIIVDQGNVNEETIRYLRWLIRYNFHFLSMVRSSSVGRFAKNLDSRREKFGFFALFTHCDMTPVEMIKVYKSRDLVEKGFQELNTDFSVCPIMPCPAGSGIDESRRDSLRHSEDRRIETHTIFTVYGYFFVSILRAILKGGGVEYSFRELRLHDKIREVCGWLL